ncbi:MAG: hypothetical protein VX627_00610 [Candidatus Thermoplasmatota archaeon]|nr:hypothetical protein [Candidatus Thermoplasmatota archaeon]
MSGGLLEKAQQKSDDEEGAFSATGDPDNPDFVKEKKILDAEPSGSGGLLSKATTSDSTPGGKPIMLYVAIGSLVLSMILIYLLSELPDYSGFAVLALFAASFAVAWMHIKNERNSGASLSSIQWGALIVAYLVLGAVPYVGAMDLGGRTTITDVSYDESSDSVTLTMRYTSGLFGGSFGTGNVDVKVLHDGSEVWSNAVSVSMESSSQGSGEIGSFSLNVDDFYSGNAYVVSGVDSGVAVLDEVPYTVVASIDGGDSQGIDLPPLNMTRTVNDIDQRVTVKEDGSNCGSSTSTCIDGIYIYGAFGISSSSADGSSDPSPIRGEYLIDMTMSYGGEAVITYPQIHVVGTHGTWNAGEADPDLGTGVTTIGERTSEFLLEGNAQDDIDRWYFESTEYLEDYGCYTIQFDATQSGPDANGGTEPIVDTGYYMYESHEEEGHTWETFEAVSSC